MEDTPCRIPSLGDEIRSLMPCRSSMRVIPTWHPRFARQLGRLRHPAHFPARPLRPLSPCQYAHEPRAWPSNCQASLRPAHVQHGLASRGSIGMQSYVRPKTRGYGHLLERRKALRRRRVIPIQPVMTRINVILEFSREFACRAFILALCGSFHLARAQTLPRFTNTTHPNPLPRLRQPKRLFHPPQRVLSRRDRPISPDSTRCTGIASPRR